jgi:aminoglycoside phosphotransferase (APT) family kinase protein
VDFQPVDRAADSFQRGVTPDQLTALARRAFGPDTQVRSAVELGGGLYNNTYRVALAGQPPVILRIAPEPGRQSRTERALMRNEHAALPHFAPIAALLPRTLFADFTHQLIGRDHLWQTLLPGVSAAQALASYPASERPGFTGQLGALTAQVHAVRGDRFGPVAGPTFTTWSEALLAGLSDTAADLADAGLDTTDLRAIIDVAHQGRAVLDEVTEPRLLHGDLWVPNVLLAPDSPRPRIVGVLDHDRAWWGDPAADWTNHLIARRPDPERAAFHASYRPPAADPGARWRELVYRARHTAAICLERHRLGKRDRIPDSYRELGELRDALAGRHW